MSFFIYDNYHFNLLLLKLHLTPKVILMVVSLIQKYNVPGPRYTSYPTVPYWEENLFSDELWKKTFLQSFQESNDNEGISLYIHLPFCESLCTFCGCNKRITKRHDVENPYIAAVLHEWNIYCDLLPNKPIIKEIPKRLYGLEGEIFLNNKHII